MRKPWMAVLFTIYIVSALAMAGCGGGGGGGSPGYGDSGGGASGRTPALTAANNLSSPGEALRVGDWIEVNGRDFGDTRDNGYVGFTNGSLTSKAELYHSWSDARIVCRVPEGMPISERSIVKGITSIFVVRGGVGNSNSYTAPSDSTSNPDPQSTPPPSSPSPSPSATVYPSPTPTVVISPAPAPTPVLSPVYSGGGGGGGGGGAVPTPSTSPEGDNSPSPSPSPSPDGGSPTPSPSPDGGSPTPSPSPDGGSPTPSPSPDGGSPTPSPSPDAVASKLVFTLNPADVTAGEAITPSVEIVVQDASGNTVTTSAAEITISIGTNAGGAVLAGTVTRTAVNGVAIFDDLSLNRAGLGYTLNAASGTLTAASSGAFNVSHGAAHHLIYRNPPQSGTAGIALSSIVVYVTDSSGNQVDDDNGRAVSLAPVTAPSGATIAGGDATTAGGTATFNSVILNKSGDYTLNAHSNLASGDCESGIFNIAAAGAGYPAFMNQPVNVTAGSNIPAPYVTVGVYDSLGNLKADDSSTVMRLEIASGPAGASISSGAFINVTAAQGIATFSGANFDKAGSYTLRASFAGNSSTATSSSFTVTHNAAQKLVFTVNPPASVDSGVVISPNVKVEIRDQYENPVNDGAESTASVSLSISGGGSLSGGTVSAIAGVAAYTALAVASPGTGYILTASSGAWTKGTSSAFNVTGPSITSVTSCCSGPSNTDQAKTAVTPNGDAGTKVVIVGTGFGATQGTVVFKGAAGSEKAASFYGTGWTNTSIQCIVPTTGNNHADLNIGTGYVKVTRSSGASNQSAFVICPDGMAYVPAGTQGGGQIVELFAGECEVTNAEFRLFMNSNPGFVHATAWYTTPSTPAYENLPVESVTWYEAVQYCNWKTMNTPGLTSGDCAYTPKTYNQPSYAYVAGKKGCRLFNNAGTTSQSEWEYACRAGTTTDYYWGENYIPVNMDLYCWYLTNSSPGPSGTGVQIAGQKLPNRWGFYDMSGNVMEWCNEDNGALRMIRGGSWSDGDPGFFKSSYYSTCNVSTPQNNLGFRLVRTK